MPLIFTIGTMGSGKTLELTRQCLEYYQHGYKIYTNYLLKGIRYTQLYEPLEILQIPLEEKSFLALDEMYLWFDSYISKKETLMLMRNIINSTRKRKIIVSGTTQSIGQINYKNRLLGDVIKLPRYNEKTDILTVGLYRVPPLSSMGFMVVEFVRNLYYRGMRKLFPYFDTWEILADFTNIEDKFNKSEQKKLL